MQNKTFKFVPLKNVVIQDSFWSKYIQLIENVAIPYQWEALNDRVEEAEPSHCMKNFEIAAKLKTGEFEGFVFQDTDLAKWLEAIGYLLENNPDNKWQAVADKAIELVAQAQQVDGYLNTYFTIKEPEGRWTNLRECHELYTAGHMIEAGVAYYQATHKPQFLEVVCRLADYIDQVFGEAEGKIKGYDGHQEIEIALLKLYEVTQNERYLKLSQFFLEERGQEPYYFDIEAEKRGFTRHFEGAFMYEKPYNQTHLPVKEQSEAVGHAVRAVYMYTAMAHLARVTQDQALYQTCLRVWDNIVFKKMYITGGIGSTSHGEAFTFDYDLPNDTVYAETCASIGLIFFAKRMMEIKMDGQYVDVIEKALYNTVLSGMAMDGKSFFYVNPLEVWPEACEKNPIKKHVMPIRQKWFGCACCPPNIARLLMQLGSYIYATDEKTAFVNLYISGESTLQVGNQHITIKQETNYPWEGAVHLTIKRNNPESLRVALHLPEWAKNHVLKVNGQQITAEWIDGYVYFEAPIVEEFQVDLLLEMTINKMSANPKVRADAGKVALQRGPMIYCIEEADHGNCLASISLNIDEQLEVQHCKELLGGIMAIKGKAYKEDEVTWGDSLYAAKRKDKNEIDLLAIPYAMWGNRGKGEMSCWIREK